MCLERDPSTGGRSQERRFSTLNRVYVLGTQVQATTGASNAQFQYPQSGLCAWNNQLHNPGRPQRRVSVPSIGFMCLEPSELALIGGVRLVSVPSIGFMCLELDELIGLGVGAITFQYPQSGLCAWNRRTSVSCRWSAGSFSTLNRVYVLGTLSLAAGGTLATVSVPSIGFMCLEPVA